MSMFKKATKQQARLRLALQGPSGSGKSFSALKVGRALVGPTGKIAAVDTEHGSLSKYADKFDFDVVDINGTYEPGKLIATLKEAAKEGYALAIVDSLTHFWNGPGGFLDMVDQEAVKARARGGKSDSYGAWKVVTPIYNRFIQDLLALPIHVIACMRAKQEYVKEDDNGKTRIRKVGLGVEMRDGFQYELDIEGMLDMEHNLAIGKTRCDAIDGKVYQKPGKELADALRAWLEDGAPAAASAPAPQAQPEAKRPAEVMNSPKRDTAPTPTEDPFAAEPKTADPLDAIRAEFAAAQDEAALKAAAGRIKAKVATFTATQKDALNAAYQARKNALTGNGHASQGA